jgi:LmbE family N-acetylglucosaminyl deacetylase
MHLFLSPHYDDAVLSCGGLIHRLAAAGERVTVRTVMGGKPSPGRVPETPIVRDLHARWAASDDLVEVRMQEDQAAVTSLGGRADHLNYWTDCVYRLSRAGEPLYPSEESLFGEIHPDDVAHRLLPTMVLPPREVIRAIYVPLAVGQHVDHQIVRNWGVELKKQYTWLALNFYEEYPYSEDQNAVEQAAAFFATLEQPLTLELETVLLDEADAAAKVEAIGYYQSQITTFWTDRAAMESAVRASLNHKGSGTPAENVWHVV